MQYFQTNTPIEQAAQYVAETLIKHLSDGEHILWLLSGGSSIPIAIQASAILKQYDLTNLVVTLTDERYGEIGHVDENWQQLLDGGLDLPGATLYRPLIGQDCQVTAASFSKWLENTFASVDYVISLFGVGSDGHTCGIKPESPAIESNELAVCYTGDDFTRLTITIEAIKYIDEGIIQASGDTKRQIIKDLLHTDIDLAKQPAQILKQIPNTRLYTNNPKEEK